MELPVAVQQALGESASGVSLRCASQANAQELLRMVLLSDQEGNLQAICRKEDLIDLGQLNKMLGRNLRHLKSQELTRIRARAGLSRLPALPSLTGWPTVVDSRVDTLPAVALELEDQNLAMVMPTRDFRRLTAEAKRLSFAEDQKQILLNEDAGADREQLHSAIRKLTSLRIRQRIEDTLELPPLPDTAQRIIHLRVNPNALMGDLVDIVEADPVLAAQVVSWASSSFYAAAGQVRSVHDAISRVLGFELVMDLAMGLALGRVLALPHDRPHGYVGYWEQAIWQAQSAGLLTSLMPRNGRPAFGLAYLSGLLHNFGYLVLAHVFPPHFQLVCRSREVNSHIDSSAIEQHLLGITGEQIAALLLDSWGMPEEVVHAIRYQKTPPYEGPDQAYARILALGRQLLTERGAISGPSRSVDPALYLSLGLDRTQVEQCFDQLVARKDSVLAMAGILKQP